MLDLERIKCPYCGSLNTKKYLYGLPASDYDKDKYVLGGCVVTLNQPQYKCSDCGKDIFLLNNTYLKRNDFINLVDSDKIFSKSMTLTEVAYVLDLLENEINKYKFKSDNNFIMDGRRDILKSYIEERLNNNNGNKNEAVLESLFNFWEFVNNEYCGASFSAMDRLHLSGDEIMQKWDEYKKSEIICFEEKIVIMEMIQNIRKMINE